METANAKGRKNSVRDKFNGLVATLRAEESAAADWLEEVQSDLAGIYGMKMEEAWENVSFLFYVWVMINMVEIIRENKTLPTIDVDAHLRASREWRVSRSEEERNILQSLETFRRPLMSDFETILRGAPDENSRAEVICRRAFTKLFRMIRLSEQ